MPRNAFLRRSLGFAGRTSGSAPTWLVSLSTLHWSALFAQAGIPDYLCTSCAGLAAPVEDGGKPSLAFREPAPGACSGAKPLRNGLPARISTVDILPRESTIPAVRFPNPV